jgi:heat shock protein HspQ
MSEARAQFEVGQLVAHFLFGYRGVVFDMDAQFALSDDWYDQMARSKPPKDAPWYHVLVDGATHTTYVAERNLVADASGAPVDHPLIGDYLGAFLDGRYSPGQRAN